MRLHLIQPYLAFSANGKVKRFFNNRNRMIKQHIKTGNFWLIIVIDLLLLIGAHLLAYLIRFEGHPLAPQELQAIRLILPPLLLLKIIVFYFSGLYRGMWRYTSLTDVKNILRACLIGSIIIVGALLFINRFEGFSRSVFVLDCLLTFLLITGHRVVLRLLHQGTFKLIFSSDQRENHGRRKRLLILGAGDAAAKLLNEIQSNMALPYRVIGLLDDDTKKIGRRIHGVPVMGAIIDLPEMAINTRAQEVLIAIPSTNSEQIKRIVDLCRETGLPFKTLPNLNEIINGKVSIKAVRDVSYRDLLGRPPVELAQEQIGKVLSGRCVLVTGAGGSIGAELCRQIIRFNPGRLILLDAGEMNLYQVEMEILYEYGFTDYVTILGRVQNRCLLEDIFTHYKPEVVFHAAAYKHVPMIERNPWEAVYNNILATRHLIEASVRHKVDRFILVSTDKAVRPTNVMGASKRMTEKIMQAYCGKTTKFMAVRFGNVLGSSGSVIPLFRRQIEMGGPVTVTHQEMTRYFMSIEEAAQLILQAAPMGGNGEIFVLEMGSPIKIAQMARDLIRLCGKEPDSEIEIKFIGLRPGEKLYEELITEGEGIIPTEHKKIMMLQANGIQLAELEEPLTRLEELARAHDGDAIKELLKKLVPEYSPQKSNAILPAKNTTPMFN